ncbi:hypothetical protein BD413DRAFT_540348 [Trametes elegans]|nr:hypothetical protein BD413DRAFT_540348 [Trametes elegans]
MGEPSGFLMPELIYLSPIMGHTLSPEALSDLPLIDQSPDDNQPSSQPPIDPHQDKAGKPGWQTPSLGTGNTSWCSGRFEPPAPAWNASHSPNANPPPVFGSQPHLGPETSDYPLSSGRFTSSVASSGPNWAWSKCVKALREHDHHVVQGWKEDVDSLLVFAGLFSAVVTAFNIESYKLLQEDPDERTASLLARISAQLEANYTTKTDTLLIPASDLHVDARSVRINTLWFSSLVLSLVSASIGILTKQWLREYTRNAASSPRENARIRQLRQEGLTRWKIPLTIALLPFLLQVAMALFFAGLLDLLWSLHRSVASVITVLVAASLSFLIFTTLMPTFSDDCPYKSPQALGAYLVMQGLAHIASVVALKVYRGLGWDRPTWPLVIDPLLFRRGRRRLAAWLLNLVHRRYFASWREREMAIVHDTADRLDHRVLADADATFMEDDFLWRTISFCLNDTECPAALHCLHEILAHRADRVIDGVPFWRHRESVDGGMNMLLHLVLDILPRIDSADSTGIEKALSVADNLCRAIPFETEHWDTIVLYQRLFDELAKLLTRALSVKMCAFGVMRKMWARSNAPVRPPGMCSVC